MDKMDSPTALSVRELSKEPKKSGSGQFGEDASKLLYELNPTQRNALLLRYAEQGESFQKSIDEVLHKFVLQDHLLLLKFKSEIEIESQSTFNKLTSKGTKSVEQKIANQAMLLEYKKFWIDENGRQLPQENAGNEYSKEPDEATAIRLKRLAAYVPKLVVRRLYNNPSPIQLPEIEYYQACVVFADVSGFTPLTEKMASMGPEGVEKLTGQLNKYFDMMISNIYRHGGDIVKFAGDAILVVWPAWSKEGLAAVIQLACQCCHSLIEELNDYEVPGTGCTLRLHIGVGAGQAGGVHVGGINKQCEFFISGQVLEQVSSCEKQALPGEVFVSAVAWMLVKKGILIGQQKGGGALANYRLEGIKVPMEHPPPVQLPLYAYMEDSFKTYIQQGVLRHIYSGTKKFIGELRTVSVVFVNLTSPFVESKLNELQASITAMQEIIYKYEGTVRQFMIDDKGSVMIAGFGLPPFAHEDDPVRAVETAMGIYAKLQELRIACSIGVTTGRAFCGDVGSDQRKEYAMVGDIVNLSARLMAAAKTGILTDNDTYDASKERIEFNKLDPIRVKGKSMPINVYVPLKRKTNTTNLKTLTSSIIGREKEVKIIQGVIRNLRPDPALEENRRNTLAPKINVIIVEGEAGVGKSRLLHETINIFKANNMPVFHGHGDQLLNTIAYHGWQSVLETSLNEKGEFIKDMKIDKDMLPLLNNVLKLNYPENQKVSLMSAQLKSDTTQALLLQILKEIVPKNSLIVLENVQWFDSGSWALTLSARQQLEGCLFMLAARTMKEKGNRVPFQYSQLLHSNQTQHIVLQNLTENDTSQLMAQALLLKTVPEEVSREIYKRSQGNPFLTEEIIYALRDSGKIQIFKNGTMSIAPDFQSTVPAGLQGLITSKLDRMSPSQQIVLKVASTIGAAFDVNMLLNVMMSTGTETSRMPFVKISDLQKDLKATESSGFVSLSTEDKQDPDNPTYQFTNSLIKDIIYGLMLFSQRRQLHGNVANYYQDTYPGKSTFYPILAYHHKQAEQNEEALDYYTKAGSSCLNTYSNKEAVTFFTEALVLAGKLRDVPNVDDITMERKLGQAYYNLGIYDKAYAQFKGALDLMGLSVGDDDKKKSSASTIRKKISTHNFFKEEKNKKVEIDKSEISHRTREAVISLLALTKVSFYTCNKPTALLCGSLALQVAPSTGAALEGEANALACLTAAIDGEFQNAELYITKGRELAGKQIDVSKSVEQFAGIYYCGRAQWEFAASALHKAVTAAKTVGDLRTLEECQLHSATILYLKGDIKKSTTTIQEALESSSRRADSQTQVIANTALARNYYSLGNYSQCLSCLEDIKLVLESIGLTDVSTEINYYTLSALMNLRQRKLEQFMFFAETAYNILARCEPTLFSTFFGYSCLVEVFMKLFLEPSYLEEGKIPFGKTKLKEKVEKTLGFLQEFSKCFQFAEARFHLWQGVWKHVGGKQSKAKVSFAKALEVARNLKMPYEEALIMHQIGLVTKNEEETKKALEMYPELQFRTVDLVSLKISEEPNGL